MTAHASFHKAIALIIAAYAVSFTTIRLVHAQDEHERTPPKPTEQHKLLKKDVGTWDAKIKHWMEPDGEPMESTGTESNRMFGDFWLLTDFQSDFGGMPYKGMGAFGYDPVKKKYVGGWIDNISPYMMNMTGEYDNATDTMTTMGEGRDPMTGEVSKTKLVTKYKGDDSRVMEFYKLGDDGEYWKTMEIKYERAN